MLFSENSQKKNMTEEKKTLQRIRNKALKILSLRAHSVFELKAKLLKKFSDQPEIIEHVLQECVEQKLLDDSSFAEMYIHHRQNTSPRGRFALRMELQRKRVDADIISEVLETISDEDERTAVEKLAKQKLLSFSQNLEKKKKKEKLFRFLSSRGFASGVIFEILEEI